MALGARGWFARTWLAARGHRHRRRSPEKPVGTVLRLADGEEAVETTRRQFGATAESSGAPRVSMPSRAPARLGRRPPPHVRVFLGSSRPGRWTAAGALTACGGFAGLDWTSRILAPDKKSSARSGGDRGGVRRRDGARGNVFRMPAPGGAPAPPSRPRVLGVGFAEGRPASLAAARRGGGRVSARGSGDARLPAARHPARVRHPWPGRRSSASPARPMLDVSGGPCAAVLYRAGSLRPEPCTRRCAGGRRVATAVP
jgi:hypothetical protein